MGAAGLKKVIHKIMTKKNKNSNKQKLQQVTELLEFVLSLDDKEIMKSAVESVIEILKEINN